MTTPERIWAWCYIGERDQGRWSLSISGTGAEYVLRAPAVLAELPEVRDLMRRAYAAGWNAYHAQQQTDWTDTRGVEQTQEADLDAIAAAIREGRG